MRTDNDIRLWDLESKSEIVRVDVGASFITQFDFSPDGNYLGASTSVFDYYGSVTHGGQARVINLIEWTITRLGAFFVTYSPNGVISAYASDETIEIVDEKGWDERLILRRHWSDPDFTALACSDDIVAIGKINGEIEIWSVNPDSFIVSLPYSESFRVRDLEFFADGRKLIALHDDDRLRVWNTKSWKSLTTPEYPVSKMALSPKTKEIAIAIPGSSTIEILDTSTWSSTASIS